LRQTCIRMSSYYEIGEEHEQKASVKIMHVWFLKAKKVKQCNHSPVTRLSLLQQRHYWEIHRCFVDFSEFEVKNRFTWSDKSIKRNNSWDCQETTRCFGEKIKGTVLQVAKRATTLREWGGSVATWNSCGRMSQTFPSTAAKFTIITMPTRGIQRVAKPGREGSL
jgi:hypothetical protein